MKQVVYLALWAGLALGQIACDNRRQAETSKEATNGKMPKIELNEKQVYDFGEITEGDTVEHNFQFTNGGEFPLIINNITASCGCTTPEWPHDPIAPGQESSIKVRFNKGQNGHAEQNHYHFCQHRTGYVRHTVQGDGESQNKS